jgi:ATP-dependent RNA helicase DHX37/DHR1
MGWDFDFKIRNAVDEKNNHAFTMPKFVPRQRKHKVLARSKNRGVNTSAETDTNAVEYIPPAKTALEEEKRRLKEELQNQGPKLSGKKAKRLEKYIDTKLRKDENRELIKKLASARVDTSLYQSSKKLGQVRETKREQLGRALRDRQAGIDIDGDNEDILFERKPLKSGNGELAAGESDDDDDDEETSQGTPISGFQKLQNPVITPFVAGVGLKRPLEVDGEGKPLLKKRKKRGGIKSKLSFKHVPTEEPAWEGFSSAEESDENSQSQSWQSDSESGIDEVSLQKDSASLEDGSNGTEETGSSSDDDSESEDSGAVKQQRSSAFKAWANQQRNEAMDYKSVTATQNATETPKIVTFTPRAPEEDPLPLELKLSKNISRKAYSVSVVRLPEIQVGRLQLPVVAEEQKIMEAIHNHPTVVIYGATGSGKTTQVPQFLYEAGYGSSDSPTPGMIGITQPRRVAAVSMAKRVGDELGDHGHRVAYQIRFEGTVSPQTAIKFMTDGVLLREVAQDIALRRYSAIVIDEAHERSVNTDILIGMMSRVVKLREEVAAEDSSIKPLKLIIMSATLRVTDFTENTTLFAVPPPVLQAEGRQYPVTNHFSRKTPHDYIEESFRKISKGHRKLPPGGFLVFLTGQNEITHVSKKLKEAFHIGTTSSGPRVRISGQDASIEAEDVDFGDVLDDGEDSDTESQMEFNDDDDFEVDEADTGPSKMHVLPLYSLLPTREQLRVFEPPPDGARLVILATNVAETSLTIPGIRYVFDCGRSKERKYDRQTGVQSFEVGWISKASASQRAGRAGRTGPGHCYRLFSSAVYERDFQEFAEPEILRMPIEGVVLQLKAMNLQHIVNFPFPTPPDRQSLANSEKLLSYLSAISPSGQITPTGITMSIFPLSPRFARILLIGHLHDCIQYTIALVAGLSAADVFIPENQAIPSITPRDENTHFTNEDRLQEDARASVRRAYNKVQKEFCFLDEKSDAIKLLQVVGEYAHEPTEAWCAAHFVRSKPLKEILRLRHQITGLLHTNIPAFANLKFLEKLPPPLPKQVKALKQMVAAGFIDHVAMRADLSPTLAATRVRRKSTRAIDVPYLTLFPSHLRQFSDGEGEADKAVYIHPSSPLAHLSPQECPDYIIYSHLQRSTPSSVQLANVETKAKIPKTRMHALTDVTGAQLAALAKGTPLVSYGKPIKEVKGGVGQERGEGGKGDVRECWVIPYLRAEGVGGIGWPLPARRVMQRKVPGRGWVVE